LVARADVALGIFGRTDKAGRVVPNKVYQTLALGKALISGDTPAIRDAFTPGEHLLTVPTGDPQTLAEAITALVDNPARREKLGRVGRSRVEAAYSEKALGARLLEIIR
jgi:glycosyltransferase involved in cell wall biosynthesis